MTDLARTREELASTLADRKPGQLVLVPTMGALHAGHGALLAVARAVPSAYVVTSIFVNPLQFGPGEDLDRYPRTLDTDLATCAAAGVDLVFAPSAADMYPGGRPAVTVDPGPMGKLLEGEFRPGFFGGVLTVVLKLLSVVRPDIAVFGEKDAQQLAMIRQMVADFDLGVRIEPVPTVRDRDGLALSSRNRYLSDADRAVALEIPRALRMGAAAAGGGPAKVLAAARTVLDQSPKLDVDYLALVDPATFAPAVAGPAVLAVAARAGATRLIDNALVDLGGPVAAGH
jgi:pantoate--beta-alanine ligase